MSHGTGDDLSLLGPVPTNAEDMPTYIYSLVGMLQFIITDLHYSLYVHAHNAPDKLVDGMIRRADGSDWDPGSGEGLYQYNEDTAAWTKL